MDIFERWFEQDLTKKVGIQHAESLAFSGNNASNVVGVYVYKDGAPAELAGVVTGTVIRQDGTTVPLTGTLSGNAVSTTLTEACFAVPGYIGVALTVTSGDITMTVLKATFEVEPIETGTVVDPSGEITANVAELISDIEAAVATIPPSYSDLLAAVAPTFDAEASTPYPAGAYVWYDGALYRFIADHTGSWTGSDAVAVYVGKEMTGAISTLDGIGAIVCGWEQGRLSTTGGTSSTAYAIRSSDFIPVDAYHRQISAVFANVALPDGATSLQLSVYEYTALSPSSGTNTGNISTTDISATITLRSDTVAVKFVLRYMPVNVNIIVPEMHNLACPMWTFSPAEGFISDIRTRLAAAETGMIAKIPNMYDKSTDTVGYYINGSGTIEESAYFEYSEPIPVSANANYCVTGYASGSGSSYLRVHSYDASDQWIRQEGISRQEYGIAGPHVCNFRTAPNAAYVRISVRQTDTNTFMAPGHSGQSYGVIAGVDQVLTPAGSFLLAGKKLSILGASISTFSGYIPSGYSAYYPHETTNAYPVADVHDTYWQKVIDATGMELLVDNASAGSYCTTGHGADAMAGCGDRCVSLDDGNTMPDVIIIQLGGNDFTRSTPLGTYDGTQEFPVTTDTFREAYAVMLNKITTKYTGATVLCGTIPIIRGGTYVTNTFPAKNKDQGEGKPGGILLEEYNRAIRELAALFGCKVVEFSRCGLTFNNVGTYMQDYTGGGYGQHPNRFGHSMMANEVLLALGQAGAEMYQNQ